MKSRAARFAPVVVLTSLLLPLAAPAEATATTVAPSRTANSNGSPRSGTYANLATDDDVYYEHDSSTASTYTASFYIMFAGVPNSLDSLTVHYRAMNSRPCAQSLFIKNQTTGGLVQLDSRTVGTTEVLVEKGPGGTLGDYVTGTYGSGEVRLRVKCRTTAGTFFISADLANIAYTVPADTTPPTVTAVAPPDGSAGTTIRSTVDVTFSEAMDTATAEAAFSLVDPSLTQVGGAFSWVRNTMTFTPSAPLAEETTYTAVMGTGAKDRAGNALAAESSWSFATGPATDPVVAAAGDIACYSYTVSATSCHHKATSDLLVGAGLAAVLPLGDLQYGAGELAYFNAYYDPTWGRVRKISYPVPGDREYKTPGASGYYAYWQAQPFTASPGYYSFDVGSWHLIALNSNCVAVGGCGAGSPQEQWLRADLAAHPASCTLAYWHEPLFSSGAEHGSDSTYRAFWSALHDHGADVVLASHDRVYERLAPQDPLGVADPANGIRQFTVGTGGKILGQFGTALPTSEVRHTGTFGVLELTLHSASYDWEFVPEAGGTFTDTGSTACH